MTYLNYVCEYFNLNYIKDLCIDNNVKNNNGKEDDYFSKI